MRINEEPLIQMLERPFQVKEPHYAPWRPVFAACRYSRGNLSQLKENPRVRARLRSRVVVGNFRFYSIVIGGEPKAPFR